MKRRLLILVSVAVAAFLVVGGVFIRSRKSRLKSSVELQRYPHQHLSRSEWEQSAKLPAGLYKLREGDSIAGVAERRYGHERYSDVIQLHNKLPNASSVAAGTELDLPDLSTIFAEEGLTRVAGPEVEMILCSRAKFDRLKNQLAIVRQTSERVTVPQSIRQELLEAVDDLQQATDNLKHPRPGLINSPVKTIRQFEDAMYWMRGLANGSNGDYDIDMVQQRYAHAIANAIIWAREGFN
jgi:hypothetical protein